MLILFLSSLVASRKTPFYNNPLSSFLIDLRKKFLSFPLAILGITYPIFKNSLRSSEAENSLSPSDSDIRKFASRLQIPGVFRDLKPNPGLRHKPFLLLPATTFLLYFPRFLPLSLRVLRFY